MGKTFLRRRGWHAQIMEAWRMTWVFRAVVSMFMWLEVRMPVETRSFWWPEAVLSVYLAKAKPEWMLNHNLLHECFGGWTNEGRKEVMGRPMPIPKPLTLISTLLDLNGSGATNVTLCSSPVDFRPILNWKGPFCSLSLLFVVISVYNFNIIHLPLFLLVSLFLYAVSSFSGERSRFVVGSLGF